jgi:hypothetical protein
VSVTELFLEALHAQVTPGTKHIWETLLKADAAEPGSKDAVRFAEYARTAWGAVEPRIAELLGNGGGGGAGPGGPVLLTEAGVFARFDMLYSGSPADFFAGYRQQKQGEHGLTDDDLRKWQPLAATRGRRAAVKK